MMICAVCKKQEGLLAEQRERIAALEAAFSRSEDEVLRLIKAMNAAKDRAEQAEKRASEEHELYLTAHRDNMKGAALLMDAEKRVRELEAWKDSASEVLGKHLSLFQDAAGVLRPYAKLGEDLPTIVGRVVAKLAAQAEELEKAKRAWKQWQNDASEAQAQSVNWQVRALDAEAQNLELRRALEQWGPVSCGRCGQPDAQCDMVCVDGKACAELLARTSTPSPASMRDEARAEAFEEAARDVQCWDATVKGGCPGQGQQLVCHDCVQAARFRGKAEALRSGKAGQ